MTCNLTELIAFFLVSFVTGFLTGESFGWWNGFRVATKHAEDEMREERE